MKKLLLSLLLLLSLATMGCAAESQVSKEKMVTPKEKVVLGIENMDEAKRLLQGRRVGLFTNQTGVDSQLKSSVDIIREKYNLAAVYVPEHGLFGAVAAGEKFEDAKYEDIPIISLYGSTRRPTEAMLEKIDVMCVDIQDIGARHYTYFSSLAYIMEECAKKGVQVVVFDRPNPLGGKIQGPVLKPQFKTFVGLYEIPLRHGLTIGEYAKYINSKYNIRCFLKVVPMKHYRRDMYWSKTGLPWVMTSPLIPTAETAWYYLLTGVIGDTSLSNGVGTAKPFYFVGAPFIKAKEFKEELEKLPFTGVKYRLAAYMPRYGAYKGETVNGVEIYLEDPEAINLPELQYRILYLVKQKYPELAFPDRGHDAEGTRCDIGLGEDSIRKGEEPEKAFARWNEECRKYAEDIKPFLLYK